MLKKSLIAGFATLALGLGMIASAPAQANAGTVELYLGGPSGGIYVGSGHRNRHYRGHRSHSPRNYHRPRHRAQFCHPGRAVNKAERRGIRHARVDRVNHRFVVVKGRKRGSKIKMAFYRDAPRCEVAWVKRKPGRGYRY